MQSLVLSLRIAEARKDTSTSARWVPETFRLPDGQPLLLHWMFPDCSGASAEEQGVCGVVLLCHTVCGMASDYLELAVALAASGFAVVGMNRRGHGMRLAVPRFNTTGCPDDLEAVLRHVKVQASLLPSTT